MTAMSSSQEKIAKFYVFERCVDMIQVVRIASCIATIEDMTLTSINFDGSIKSVFLVLYRLLRNAKTLKSVFFML